MSTTTEVRQDLAALWSGATAEVTACAYSDDTMARAAEVTAPMGSGVHPDLYRYARSAAYRAVGSVSGADWQDVAHDVLVSLLSDGADLGANTDAARSGIAWAVKSARRDAIRAAQRAGEMPDDTGAGGDGVSTLDYRVTTQDVRAAAWLYLQRSNVEAYRLAVWATYAPIGRGGMPATGTVLPFRDTTDRDTRGRRVRDAIGAYDAACAEVTAGLRAAGIGITDPHGAVPLTRVSVPLVDADALARRYGWDDETAEGARAVCGPLSGADMRGLMRHDVVGPAGDNLPRRAERAKTGARGRSGSMSGLPGAGTVAGAAGEMPEGVAWRDRLASERIARTDEAREQDVRDAVRAYLESCAAYRAACQDVERWRQARPWERQHAPMPRAMARKIGAARLARMVASAARAEAIGA